MSKKEWSRKSSDVTAAQQVLFSPPERLRSVLRRATQMLETQGSSSPALDAQLLLMQVLDCARSYLFSAPEHLLDAPQCKQFSQLLARRLSGEPVAYILGYREFWGIELAVSDAVLIPRPETELLVELGLDYLQSEYARYQTDKKRTAPVIVDAGTGSGAIAVALAYTCRAQWVDWFAQIRFLAIERSWEALLLAQKNIQRYALQQQLTLCHGHWLSALKAGSCDLILSNPPYIDAEDPHLQQGDVRFEPQCALVSAQQGLADIEQICAEASRVLKPGGCLLLEHGWQQAEAVRMHLRTAGFSKCATHKDLAGYERVSMGYWFG